MSQVCDSNQLSENATSVTKEGDVKVIQREPLMFERTEIRIGAQYQVKLTPLNKIFKKSAYQSKLQKLKLWDSRHHPDQKKIDEVFKQLKRKVGRLAYSLDEFMSILYRTNYDLELISELIQKDGQFLKTYFEMRSNI